jgi:hypothetical protein
LQTAQINALSVGGESSSERAPLVEPESGSGCASEGSACTCDAGGEVVEDCASPTPGGWVQFEAQQTRQVQESRVASTYVTDLDVERGHRVLRVTRKGGKSALIPLAPRTSAALDSYIDDRTEGRSSSVNVTVKVWSGA